MGWIPEAGGVTDHGALTGLADDDHPQYLTEAEHDAHDHTGVPGVGTTGDGCAELLMQDGVTDPPVPLENEDQTDWLYEECSDEEGEATTDEDTYWAHQAAILDPDAYTLEHGTSWTVTVPADEVYYMLSAWRVDPDTRFHRRPEPMPISEGTTFESSGATHAHAWFCDPGSVTVDRAKYFERKQRLGTLTQHTLDIAIADGASKGDSASAAFPTDFTNGLIIAVSVYDLSWLALSPTSEDWAINLWDEITDDHQHRFSGPVLFPFKRTDFQKISGRAAVSHSTTTEGGWGTVTYVKLPADW